MKKKWKENLNQEVLMGYLLNKVVHKLFLIAAICFIMQSTAYSDPASGFISRVNCNRHDCKNAYMRFIKLKNPWVKDDIARQIVESTYRNAKILFPKYPEEGVEVTICIMGIESHFKPKAMGDGGKSFSLMQIKRSAAKKSAEFNNIKEPYNLKNIDDNIKLGMGYLKYLHNRYGRWDYAITAYNMGTVVGDKFAKAESSADHGVYISKYIDNRQLVHYMKREEQIK